ncbi:MAG: DUF4363 family protein [Oscillospiraceae bacterium]|nr:DUF4363 family protein [Oscillospiraceae bacterium]
MKTTLLSAGALLLLLLGGLGNSVYLSHRCAAWERQLDSAEEAVTQEQWAAAQSQLEALYRSWDKCEPYLHIVAHHEDVEQSLVLLEQCRLFAALEDGDALLSAGEQLRCQYRHLAETEELRLQNIL